MTHTAMVRVYCGGKVCAPGEPADYDGPPDWKYRPTDPARRKAWESAFADPARVADVNFEMERAPLVDPSRTNAAAE